MDHMHFETISAKNSQLAFFSPFDGTITSFQRTVSHRAGTIIEIRAKKASTIFGHPAALPRNARRGRVSRRDSEAAEGRYGWPGQSKACPGAEGEANVGQVRHLTVTHESL